MKKRKAAISKAGAAKPKHTRRRKTPKVPDLAEFRASIGKVVRNSKATIRALRDGVRY